MTPDTQEGFYAWFDEVENYATRGERFLDDMNMAAVSRHPPFAYNTYMAWLKAAFEQGALYERQKTAK